MKSLRLFGLLGLLVVLMVAAVDCSSAAKPLETEPDFAGFITEIHKISEKDTLGQIHVESRADKLVEKYVVTIKDETLIFENKYIDNGR